MKPFIVSLLYDLPLNRKTLAEQRAIKIIPVKPTEVKIPSPRIFSSVYIPRCVSLRFFQFLEIYSCIVCLLVIWYLLIPLWQARKQKSRAWEKWRSGAESGLFSGDTPYIWYLKSQNESALLSMELQIKNLIKIGFTG